MSEGYHHESNWDRAWVNILALVVACGLLVLFVSRAFGGEVQFIRGSYPAISESIANPGVEVEHDSFELISDFVAQGIDGNSKVSWTIPVELESDVQDLTLSIYGAMFSSQLLWDDQVVGGVGVYSENLGVHSTRGRLMATLPPESSVEGVHELTLTVVGQHGEGRMTGELVWGERADVISHYRYLRFLTHMIEGTFAVLAITFFLIAAIGYEREEFFVWGWYLIVMGFVTPAFSGMWDLFSDSMDLQRRIQFIGLIVVPISTVLQPAWMMGVHRKKAIYLPVIFITLMAIVLGSTLNLSLLVQMKSVAGIFAISVIVATTIFVFVLAIKGYRAAVFFALIATFLGAGAVSAVLAAMGLISDYQVLLPCAAMSSGATAVYFIVRHSALANRYATLVNSVGDGILVVDRGGRIREANLAAKSLLRGKLGLFKDSILESEHDLFEAHAHGVRLGQREEFHLKGKKGEMSVVESMSVRLTDGTTLLALRDIRERMELELGMAQAARIEATELVVIELARDLQACVETIYSVADSLKKVCKEGRAKNRHDRLLDVLKRCANLGDQLSMLASGVGSEAEEFVIDNVLVDVIDSLEQSLGEQIVVERKLGVHGVLVRGVIQEVESVFMNLIFNSRDAVGDRGGTVWLESSLSGDSVEISIEDDGPGIPEELWSRVWEPFFSTKSRGKGGGVGLSVVARVIRRHNGRCRIERGTRAGGARLVVTFPIVSRLS